MPIRRILAVVAVVGLFVFAISFLHGAAKYRRQTLWLDRVVGQFHSIQGLGTDRPILSEPLGGGVPGRYGAMMVGDDLLVIHETEVPRASPDDARRSVRRHLLLRRNAVGGWDLLGAEESTAPLDGHPDPVAEGEKLAAAAAKAPVAHEYLMPVRDNFVLAAAVAAFRRSQGWQLLIEDERAKAPQDATLLLAAIQARAAAGDAAGLEKDLAALESLPDFADRPMLAATAAHFRKLLESGEAGAAEDDDPAPSPQP